jgi:hypothetical protein
MTAFTDTLGFYKGTAAFGAHADKKLGYVSVKLDFAKIVAARAAASATALAAADTLQVLQIPAGALMLAGGLTVSKAETTNTTATFDLGCTGGSPIAANAFVNDGASNAVANLSTGLAAPVLFSSADTIDLLINTAAPTDAIVWAWAYYLDANAAEDVN